MSFKRDEYFGQRALYIASCEFPADRARRSSQSELVWFISRTDLLFFPSFLFDSDGVGYFAGAPEGMMNVVRKAEKGVEKVSAPFPIFESSRRVVRFLFPNRTDSPSFLSLNPPARNDRRPKRSQARQEERQSSSSTRCLCRER